MKNTSQWGSVECSPSTTISFSKIYHLKRKTKESSLLFENICCGVCILSMRILQGMVSFSDRYYTSLFLRWIWLNKCGYCEWKKNWKFTCFWKSMFCFYLNLNSDYTKKIFSPSAWYYVEVLFKLCLDHGQSNLYNFFTLFHLKTKFHLKGLQDIPKTIWKI